MRRHPTAPVKVARISAATPEIDFTAPDRDFAALIRAIGFCRSGLDRACPAGLYVSATHEITPMPDNILSPKRITAEACTDAAAAVARLTEIYERNVSFLRTAFEAYVGGEPLDTRVRATYPFVRIATGTHARLDSRLSYGFVSGPGIYETSVTWLAATNGARCGRLWRPELCAPTSHWRPCGDFARICLTGTATIALPNKNSSTVRNAGGPSRLISRRRNPARSGQKPAGSRGVAPTWPCAVSVGLR